MYINTLAKRAAPIATDSGDIITLGISKVKLQLVLVYLEILAVLRLGTYTPLISNQQKDLHVDTSCV